MYDKEKQRVLSSKKPHITHHNRLENKSDSSILDVSMSSHQHLCKNTHTNDLKVLDWELDFYLLAKCTYNRKTKSTMEQQNNHSVIITFK